MKKRKLKNWVLPTIYVLVIAVSFYSISILNNHLLGNITNYDYSKSLMKDATEAVLSESIETPQEEETAFLKPTTADNVSPKVTYYSKDDGDEKQQNSLILYENTYMPSTGIIYTSDSEFDVIAVYDGTIKSVKNDSMLGNVVEISHNANLTTFYYSLKNVTLKQGDSIKAGTTLGKSSPNSLVNENSVLFEVYYQGKSLDPEKFYETKPSELK